MRSTLATLALICSMVSASPALAQQNHLYAGLGVEVWPTPEAQGHGYGMLTYQRLDMWRGAQLELTFNTDTLFLGVRGVQLGERLSLGGFAKGEVIFSGLLVDYYERGIMAPERGFAANYVQAGVQLDVESAPVFMQLELGGSQWSFARREATAQDLVLPATMAVFEPRLRVTFWSIRDDVSISEPHRHYWRVVGFGAGAELGVDVREGWEPWGQREALGEDDPARLRNASGRVPLLARFWMRHGIQAHDRFRYQGALYASLGQDEDDLTRSRAGGMSPYSVSMAGMPWASLLPDNFFIVQLSAHLRVVRAHEVGVLVDAMQLAEADALRVNEETSNSGLSAAMVGAGLFTDWRWGDGWQVHTRAGYTLPNPYMREAPHLSVWASLGKRIF